MFFHIARAVKLVARVEKFPVIALADQFVEFPGGQALLVQIAKLKINSLFLQETSCFAARSSSWLVKKLCLDSCHLSSRRTSVPRHPRIHFNGPAFNAAGHRARPLDALRAQPSGSVKAPHAVMTEKHDRVRLLEPRKVRRYFAQRNQR